MGRVWITILLVFGNKQLARLGSLNWAANQHIRRKTLNSNYLLTLGGMGFIIPSQDKLYEKCLHDQNQVMEPVKKNVIKQ